MFILKELLILLSVVPFCFAYSLGQEGFMLTLGFNKYRNWFDVTDEEGAIITSIGDGILTGIFLTEIVCPFIAHMLMTGKLF